MQHETSFETCLKQVLKFAFNEQGDEKNDKKVLLSIGQMMVRLHIGEKNSVQAGRYSEWFV